MNRTAESLIKLIDARRYEEALGVSIGEGKAVDVFDLKADHSGNLKLLERIHIAESILKSEKHLDRLMRIRNIGVSLVNENDFRSAVPYFEYAATTGKTADDFFGMGYAYLRTGKYQQAMQPLERALAREHELSEAYRNGFVDSVMLEGCLKIKDMKRAEHYAQEAARKGQPDRVVASVLLEHKQYRASLQYLERVAKKEGDPRDHLNLGYAYFKSSRSGDALVELTKALGNEGSLPSELKGTPDLLLFEVYLDQHNRDKADHHLRAAARKGHAQATELVQQVEHREVGQQQALDRLKYAAATGDFEGMLKAAEEAGLPQEQLLGLLQRPTGRHVEPSYSRVVTRPPPPLWRRILGGLFG